MQGSDLLKHVVFIDKHGGPTSFGIVEEVSKIVGAKKAGHSGTLDPNATGLMLIALGEARKAMPVLTGLDKEYVGTMKLHADAAREDVGKALMSFVGRIRQTPPVRSAVARRERERTVHEMEVTGFKGRDVEFRILCEAGTYIRKIAHDAGEKLGCGAHLTGLRRTKAGPFSIEESITVDKLRALSAEDRKKRLVPLEQVLERVKLPRIVIGEGHVQEIRNGSPVRKGFVKELPDGLEDGGYAGVYDENGSIICLATISPGGDRVAKTERVFLA